MSENEIGDRKRPSIRPRRWLGLVVWAAMIAFFAWLWPRSHQAADVIAVYTRSGNVQGVLSHRGHLLFVSSTLSLGPEKALTAEHLSAPVEDGDWLFDGTYTNASQVGGRWGFGYSLSKPGDLPVREATWSAVVIPHWAAIAFCSLVLLWHVWRFIVRSRERRWRKQGRCLECGYDLQGAPSDRCPECGLETGGMATSGGFAVTTKRAANVLATVLLLAATAWAARLYLKPPSDTEQLRAAEAAAGLDATIDYIRFDDARHAQILKALQSKSPLHVTVSPREYIFSFVPSTNPAGGTSDPNVAKFSAEFKGQTARTILRVAGDMTPMGLRVSVIDERSAERLSNTCIRTYSLEGLPFERGWPRQPFNLPGDELSALLEQLGIETDVFTFLSPRLVFFGEVAILPAALEEHLKADQVLAALRRCIDRR